MVTPNASVTRSAGPAVKPRVHGCVAAQLPNGETSCASPRICDAVALPSLTAISPLSAGRAAAAAG